MPLFLGWIGAAHAFCGTYVGSPGVELVNRTSQVVLARQGDKTTLTLVADYEGPLSDFALLIPVPESLEPDRIRTIDPAVVDRLDRYSTPRLVSYTCRDAVDVTPLGCSLALGGCGAEAAYDSLETVPIDVDLEAAAGSVTVEAEFQVAEYDVALLSAEGADGLYAWLELEGYAIPEGGEDVLQGYIDAGSHFLAAKVHLDAVADAAARLSPLQLRYTAEDWTLPLLIGTISGRGEQEVIVYALTNHSDGDVAIANYPEQEVEDECMWPADEWASFGDFYKDSLYSARQGGEIGWVTEYNWTLYSLSQDTGYHCDPCTVEREELYDAGELQDLGFTDPNDGYTTGSTTWSGSWTGSGGGDGALLTRLRMVYDPSEIHEDLVLYTTGLHETNRQIRYVEYDRRLEFLFPVCGQGFADEPGMCGDEKDEGAKGKGASSFPTILGLAGIALGFLVRRARIVR